FTDQFFLGSGQFAIEGSEKDDYIRGQDDRGGWFNGADGNDTIVGGAFGDTADYNDDDDGDDGGIYGAIVNLSESSITVSGVTGYAGGVTVGSLKARDSFGDTDTLSSIENIWSSARSDFLMGSSAANWLAGAEGNDTLDGGAGNDNLVGDEGNDFLQGGAGNDTLDAGRGVDVADGGADIDTLFVHGNFAAYLRSRPTATDTRLFNALTGEDITFRNVESVNFQDGNKSLDDVQSGVGIGNNDSLVGTLGDDTLDGLAGVDTLVGLEGNDTYVVDVAEAVI
ncbi:MAG: hypothetical protein JNJ72_19695, partial [Anaerolineales bacterium]|nr:hypothetical protein [Anaerolineales bacterium]